MRKIILSIALLVFVLNSYSQNIVAGEYFFNTDPGKGAGVAFIFDATSSLELDLNIPLPDTLSTGANRLYFRFKDELGRWSHNHSRNIFIAQKQESDKTIKAIEYYIDTVGIPGEGSIVSLEGTTQSVSVDENIDLSGLDYGTHHLYVRALNSGGTWGEYTRRSIHVTPEEDKITSIDYYYSSGEEISETYTYFFEEPANRITTNVLLSADNLVVNQEYALHVVANSNNGVKSFMASREFMFHVNHSPTVLKNEVNLSIMEGSSYFISMDTLFTDDDFQIGDSLAYEIVGSSPQSIMSFIAWADHETLKLAPELDDEGISTFWIKATDKAGVSDSLQVNLTVEGVVGIGANTYSQAFKVYPIPTHNKLTISLEKDADNFTYKLFSLSGRILLSGNSEVNEKTLELRHLPKGMYYLQVMAGGKLFTEQIILQ